MESIQELYRVGNGPSSSHTMGPAHATEIFKKKSTDATAFRVTLYGSLAATGKGHFTDTAIENILAPAPVKIVWNPDEALPLHPNGMKFEALGSKDTILHNWIVYSVGGGAIRDAGNWDIETQSAYSLFSMDEILAWCGENGSSLWEFVEHSEGQEIWPFLKNIWQTMEATLRRGISNEGLLPGTLHLARKAASYHIKAINASHAVRTIGSVFAYALAVSEENAAGGIVVTAPTCGSAGVLPATLYYLRETYRFSEKRILHALATAGLIGNLVKKNASISGAEVGCQGEIGTACAMASAAAAQLLGGTVPQIEYAAEMGMEHHLGLTCDPVEGYVQIPCIERNAVAAGRALHSATFALFSDGRHRISFDEVVRTMKETGLDMGDCYKETARCGLARHWLDSESGAKRHRDE
ncbi:MAG: L-serine ammonia-lyase [Acidobacteria bacterium]|nr:L-serine ammonia-lyase [Acidobacteriota bacterium]